MVVEEHARNLSEHALDLFQLLQRLGAHQHTLLAAHGIPDHAPIVGDASDKSVRAAIFLHFRWRSRGVHRDGHVMGMEQ